MSEELVNEVQGMLKEETWTRAAIGNYTKNNLTQLSEIVGKARTENCEDDVKKICDDVLVNSKDSIVALYISGMISLGKGALDNSALVSLIDIFEKNHKELLVEYLCQTILTEDPQNKFALRKLAEYYKNTNNDKVWDLYEQIVKQDFEEADIAKILAERYESQSNKELAVSYYKKALLRYVSAKNINAVKEVWTKLVKMIPEEIDFFLLVQRKVAKTISEDKSALLMQEVYQYYKSTAKWDIAIDILKLILSIDNKDSWARKEIVDCFRGKYADHSHLDDYIKSSNLNQSFRNVFEAISDFEKHIAFDAKNFVFHRSWGVGLIRKVQGDMLSINFGKKNGIHEMSLKMAVSALQPLASDHIWVLKATTPRAELVKHIKDDKTWALKTIIKSFTGCDDKRIKAELVPSLLTPGEWTSWHTAAQKILSTDSTFGVSPEDINVYIVRDHAISPDEKLANEFKAEKQFFARIDIIMRFIQDDETDKDSELFSDMFSYFAGYLKSFSIINEQVVASYLVIQHISKLNANYVNPAKFTFYQLYEKIENPREMYLLLKDTKNTSLKDDYIADIRMLADWDNQYIKMFPTVLKGTLLTALITAGKKEKVQKLVANSFENYKDYREAAIYFFKECQDDDWFKEANITYEKQLIALINIISICYREIDNHVNSTDNKKIIKAASTLLFIKDNTLLNYMLEKGTDTCTRLYTMVNDVKGLEQKYKAQLRNGILTKFPDFKFKEAETKAEQPKGLIVTAAKLEEKKAQADDIEKVQIPENSKEVSDARAKGDLKENAEYSSAKEHQHYLNVTLTKLREEISRAVIFDPTTITTSLVSFGTEIVLHNEIENKDETYKIFGPWESNPDEGIISYMSPFGNALLDAKVGEKRVFTINDNNYNYTIKSISVAK
ncbi:MAG: transcription elongation factor GreA [Treponema sp.]